MNPYIYLLNGAPYFYLPSGTGTFYDLNVLNNLTVGNTGVFGSDLTVQGSSIMLQHAAGDISLSLQNNATANTAAYISYKRSTTGSTRLWYAGVGLNGDGGWGLYDGTGGSFAFQVPTTGNFLIGTTTDNSAKFAAARTGAAPANSGAISTAAIRAVDVSNDLALDIGVNSSVSPYPGWIQVHGRTNQATNYPLALNPNGGVVLLNTSVNSANGALQLATHTTSAGGIGFGTDVSLYRSAAATLTSTANNLFLANDSVFGGNFNTNVEVVASSNAIYLNTNGGTALTLDSGKNTTAAGWVKATAFQMSTDGQGTILSSNASTLYLDGGAGDIVVRPKLNAGNFYIKNGGQLVLDTAKTPSSASDTGIRGTVCWDSSYIYVCTATNTWKRVAIATW